MSRYGEYIKSFRGKLNNSFVIHLIKQGDSGGPLYVVSSQNQAVIGVVSYGANGCGQPGVPQG